jgi:Mg2+ and Co2+ transporter CorA
MSNDKLENLVKLCSDAVGVDITAKKRDRDTYMYGRAVFYNVAKKLYPGITLMQLGKCVNRDHATVLYAIRNSKDTYMTDPVYLAIYNRVLSKIEATPNDYNIEHDKLIYEIPSNIARYVNKLYDEVNQLKKINSELEAKINNNILWEYVNQIPSEHVHEFIQYRVIPFINFKLNTNDHR